MEQKLLGKYELLESLGQGGMGEVWKARDTQLRRFVAIKLLHAELQANSDFVSHFMREAQFVASLRHPNIVQIHDFQLTNSQESGVKAYMVMDYIKGGTLSDYMRNTVRKGLFPTATEIVTLFGAISLALDYAHQKGMIHRDIKPANILLDRSVEVGSRIGEPILTDFGIARLQGAGTSTLTHALVGTPLYISPEQAADGKIDERSDLYSLGIVLYEMLTGVTPFRGESAIAIMVQHMYGQAPDPALINPRISPALSAVVLQSIARDPNARFPSASAMTSALARAFDVSLPASLNNQTQVGGGAGYAPLQSPATPFFGIDAPSPAFVEAAREAYTPAGSLEIQQSPQPLTPLPATYPEAIQQRRPPRPRRKWVFAGIGSVLLALILVSAFVIFPLVFPPATPTHGGGAKVVGQIVFARSQAAPQNTYDQVQIHLTTIAPPPANTTYYGWLENLNNETNSPPHWPLQVQNGAIESVYSSPQHTDLLAQSNWFLITAEPANSTPFIPFIDPASHIYYALIPHPAPSSATFEVRQCVSGGVVAAVAPCNR